MPYMYSEMQNKLSKTRNSPLESMGQIISSRCPKGRQVVVVVVLRFYVPSTAKVIRRRDLGLKSHPKDLRGPVLNSRPLVYKASS